MRGRKILENSSDLGANKVCLVQDEIDFGLSAF